MTSTAGCRMGDGRQHLPLLRRSVRDGSGLTAASGGAGRLGWICAAGGKSGDEGGASARDATRASAATSVGVRSVGGESVEDEAEDEDEDDVAAAAGAVAVGRPASGCGERAMKSHVSVGRGRARRGVLRGVAGGVEAAMRSDRQAVGGGCRTVSRGAVAEGATGVDEGSTSDGAERVGVDLVGERTIATLPGSKNGSARYRGESKLCRLVGARRGVAVEDDGGLLDDGCCGSGGADWGCRVEEEAAVEGRAPARGTRDSRAALGATDRLASSFPAELADAADDDEADERELDEYELVDASDELLPESDADAEPSSLLASSSDSSSDDALPSSASVMTSVLSVLRRSSSSSLALSRSSASAASASCCSRERARVDEAAAEAMVRVEWAVRRRSGDEALASEDEGEVRRAIWLTWRASGSWSRAC